MRCILFVFMFFLAACVEVDSQNAASAPSGVIVEHDKFKNQRVIRTPLKLVRQGFTDRFPVSLSYQAIEKDGKIQNISLYVVATRSEWGFYNSAVGEDGYKFRFSETDRNVDSAAGIVTVEEQFYLAVPLMQLKAMLAGDYEIKVYGKRDSGVFRVPASLSRAFFDALNPI